MRPAEVLTAPDLETRLVALIEALERIGRELARSNCDLCRDKARKNYHTGRHSCGAW